MVLHSLESHVSRRYLSQKEGSITHLPSTLTNLDEIGKRIGFSSTDKFIEYLQLSNGPVLDLGSGYDGLAFDAKRRNLPLTIISLNPARKLRSFKATRLNKYKADGVKLFPDVTDYERDRILQQIDLKQTAISDFAHNMKSVKSNSIGTIIDSLGFNFYTHEEQDKDYYKLCFKEILRVLKVGGKMRIYDNQWDTIDSGHFNKQEVLSELINNGIISVTPTASIIIPGGILAVEIVKLQDLPELNARRQNRIWSNWFRRP